MATYHENKRKKAIENASETDEFMANVRNSVNENSSDNNPTNKQAKGPANDRLPGADDDLDDIDLSSVDFDSDPDDSDDQGTDDSKPNTREIALQAALENERLARQRLESDRGKTQSRIEELEQANHDFSDKLQELQEAAELARVEVKLDPPQALIDAIGEEAARAQYEPVAQHLRESMARSSRLESQNKKIMAVLEKAGVTSETSIDRRIDERVGQLTKSSWDSELYKRIPKFETAVSQPSFQNWAKNTLDGVNSVWENILLAVNRREPRDIDYCERALKMRAKSLGKGLMKENVSANRGGPARPISGKPTEETKRDSRDRKTKARLKMAGFG